MVMATVDYVDDKLKEHELVVTTSPGRLADRKIALFNSAAHNSVDDKRLQRRTVKAAYDLVNAKYTAQDPRRQKGLSSSVSASATATVNLETQAATPKAVKAAYDLANAKYTAQDATTAKRDSPSSSSATNSTSETLAAHIAKAVKAVMDETNKESAIKQSCTDRNANNANCATGN